MKRRFNSTQRNYIIAGLCMILVIMGVGYAAFSSQLKISGTSNITSNWSVKITDIQSKVVSGTPTNASEPTHTDTTATFRTTLTSPGDTMKYDVTVSNEGDIDAKLDKITVPESTNPAIGFEVTGIEEGSLLEAKQTAILTVTVKYNDVTEQPTDLTADLEVTLDYSQAPEGYVPPTPSGPTIGGQEVELVESGDGLYEDSYEAGRLIYRGQDPDNYITFNGETWRIIAKETDGTYKIIRNDVLANRAFDNQDRTASSTYCTNKFGCGAYAAVEGTFLSPSGSQSGTVTEDSSIKIYLNDDYYVNNINTTAKEQMTSHSFNIGAVEYLDESGAETDSIEKNIAGEKMYQWTGNVGLANVSDILRASTNPLCKSATDNYGKLMQDSPVVTCDSNYLFEIPDMAGYWTINAFSRESDGDSCIAWIAARGSGIVGLVRNVAYNDGNSAPRPVVFLKSSTTLSGSGTSDDPFTIV